MPFLKESCISVIPAEAGIQALCEAQSQSDDARHHRACHFNRPILCQPKTQQGMQIYVKRQSSSLSRTQPRDSAAFSRIFFFKKVPGRDGALRKWQSGISVPFGFHFMPLR